MPSPSSITPTQLSRLIGTPASPVLLDLRVNEDFDLDHRLIPGAFRHPFLAVETLASQWQDKHVVAICYKGKKISQGAAAILRAAGVRAELLEGGTVAWQEASQLTVSMQGINNRDDKGRTVWVTRHRPKIDRIACPWLIKRFVDPNALFMYVEPAEVINVAEKFNAAPFDVEGVFYTHRDEGCTFDTMLAEFGLDTEPLQRLATIVRGADTDQRDLAPQAAGLLAASLGFSRMYKDDLEQLEASLPLYDALYRWCREATDERHDWPMHTSKKNKG
jgi:rhodanese-related sulfurtransferase